MSTQVIIDRGRGPEIKGTRITVFDVMDYSTIGWNAAQIAAVFRLTLPEIEAALAYIDEHREQVALQYEQIIERHQSHRHSPETIAKLAESRQKFSSLVARVRQSGSAEAAHARHHAG